MEGSASIEYDDHIVFSGETDSTLMLVSASDGTIETGGNIFDFNSEHFGLWDHGSNFLIGSLEEIIPTWQGTTQSVWGILTDAKSNLSTGLLTGVEAFIYFNVDSPDRKWSYVIANIQRCINLAVTFCECLAYWQ